MSMPLSVTIRSSTRIRRSSLSVWAAYCAVRSAVSRVWASSCFSFTCSQRRHMPAPIAASGISTQITAGLNRPTSLSLSIGAFVAQALDLVGEVDALVGDDPLEHPHALLELLVMRGILRRFFRDHFCVELHLALLQREPRLAERARQDRDDRNDQGEDRDENGDVHVTLLNSSACAGI